MAAAALVPASVAAAAAAAVDWPVLAQIGVFFAEAGAFVFGSGLAIVPFLYGGVVNEYQLARPSSSSSTRSPSR